MLTSIEHCAPIRCLKSPLADHKASYMVPQESRCKGSNTLLFIYLFYFSIGPLLVASP